MDTRRCIVHERFTGVKELAQEDIALFNHLLRNWLVVLQCVLCVRLGLYPHLDLLGRFLQGSSFNKGMHKIEVMPGFMREGTACVQTGQLRD